MTTKSINIQVKIPKNFKRHDFLKIHLLKRFNVLASFPSDNTLNIYGEKKSAKKSSKYSLKFIGAEKLIVLSLEKNVVFVIPPDVWSFVERRSSALLHCDGNTLTIIGRSKIVDLLKAKFESLVSSALKGSDCSKHLSDFKIELLESVCRENDINADIIKRQPFYVQSFIYDIVLSLIDLDEMNPPVIEAYKKNITKLNFKKLRPVFIDGPNIAYGHGNHKDFSVKGLKLALQFFRNRGHTDILIFMPESYARYDYALINAWQNEGIIKLTPSGQRKGKCYSCYDDRIMLQMAVQSEAVVVSNDKYRDLIGESKEIREVIENRVLPFVFTFDHFLIPEDPFGRAGAKLNDILLAS